MCIHCASLWSYRYEYTDKCCCQIFELRTRYQCGDESARFLGAVVRRERNSADVSALVLCIMRSTAELCRVSAHRALRTHRARDCVPVRLARVRSRRRSSWWRHARASPRRNAVPVWRRVLLNLRTVGKRRRRRSSATSADRSVGLCRALALRVTTCSMRSRQAVVDARCVQHVHVACSVCVHAARVASLPCAPVSRDTLALPTLGAS